MKTTNTIARRVMILAHAIRRAAAARFGCKASEIIFGECLRQAWAEIKAEAGKPQIITNEKGFVVFQRATGTTTATRTPGPASMTTS